MMMRSVRLAVALPRADARGAGGATGTAGAMGGAGGTTGPGRVDCCAISSPSGSGAGPAAVAGGRAGDGAMLPGAGIGAGTLGDGRTRIGGPPSGARPEEGAAGGGTDGALATAPLLPPALLPRGASRRRSVISASIGSMAFSG